MPDRKQLVTLSLVVLFGLHSGFCGAQDDSGVYMGNGIKIGELTSDSVIVWTRLTSVAAPDPEGILFRNFGEKDFFVNANILDEQMGPSGGYAFQLPQGASLEEAAGAVPGTKGDVRVTFTERGNEDSKRVLGWTPVEDDRDFTRHFKLEGLKSDTEYSLTVEGRKSAASPISAVLRSSFETAPPKDRSSRVLFTVVTGTRHSSRDDGDKGHKFFRAMLALRPEFFVHTGDIVYYDLLDPYATHIDLARFRWNRLFGLPNTRDFHNAVPSYFMKDDHDSWHNDCWPTMPPRMGLFTYQQGGLVYGEQVPMSERRYRTFRWGKDLQIWLVEVRDFRSPNHDPDGPQKTMWGKEQVAWFKQTVEASDATFRILISPTPMVGPDHLWKADLSDNHADPEWSHEGDMLREFISAQKNMYFITGDRHWQYVSRHHETGMLEYSSGPSTDVHATTMANTDHSQLLYYRPKGGFLAVEVSRLDGVPTATFRHYGVTGEVFNEDVRAAD